MKLEDLGWNSFFRNQSAEYLNENLIPARVIFGGKDIYRLASEHGEFWAEIAGSLRHRSVGPEDLPVCGDWVLADNTADQDRTVIRLLLPRRTSFARQQAGRAPGEQVVAANIDIVCLVSGLDSDFNPRRIERYLSIAWESGALPVIVLNKADICPDLPLRVAEAMSLAPGVPVFTVSAQDGRGMDDILGCAGQGQTLALLGSSGVGKSSIVNRLLGKPVQEVCATDPVTGRGVHTTAARQLFMLPEGGLIMDTPGMREIQSWSAETGLDMAFEDIQSLAQGCRFRDCRHQAEPGCNVRAAVARGELDAGRLANYFKLSKEARYIELKNSHSASWVERDRWRKVAKQVRRLTPKY